MGFSLYSTCFMFLFYIANITHCQYFLYRLSSLVLRTPPDRNRWSLLEQGQHRCHRSGTGSPSNWQQDDFQFLELQVQIANSIIIRMIMTNVSIQLTSLPQRNHNASACGYIIGIIIFLHHYSWYWLFSNWHSVFSHMHFRELEHAAMHAYVYVYGIESHHTCG